MYQQGYYINKNGRMFWVQRACDGGYIMQDQAEEPMPTHVEEVPADLQFLGTMWDCPAVRAHVAKFPEQFA